MSNRDTRLSGGSDNSTDKSRRQYLRWLGITGIAGVAGCQGNQSGGDTTTTASGGGDETETTAQETTAASATGGTIRVAIPGSIKNIHPMKGVSSQDYALGELMYSRLTVLDPKTTVAKPDLATSWESNDSVDAWTFTLNEDATFANGDPVTASDVQATVNFMMTTDAIPSASRFLGDVKDTSVIDDKNIQISLKTPDTEYPRRIAETGSNFFIAPKDVLEGDAGRLADEDLGSGPFNFDRVQGGNKYILSARDDYFGTDDDGDAIPYVDQMNLIVATDALARTNSLIDKRFDASMIADPQQKSRYDQSDVSNLYQQESMEIINILLNTNKKPFDNPRVRKAFKYAIDNKALLDAIDGRGSLGYHHSVAPVHKLYADDIKDPFTREAKPEKARTILEEEGYSGDPLLELPTLIFSKGSTPEKEPQAQLFQQQMKAAGIDFDLKLVSTDTWLSEYWNKDKTWYFSGWAARAVETSVLFLAFHSEAKWNSARYDNPEYDKHLDAAMNATSQETKRKELKKAQQILHLDGPWLVTTFLNVFGAWNNYVKDVELPFSNERSYFHDARLTSDAPMGPSN